MQLLSWGVGCGHMSAVLKSLSVHFLLSLRTMGSPFFSMQCAAFLQTDQRVGKVRSRKRLIP